MNKRNISLAGFSTVIEETSLGDLQGALTAGFDKRAAGSGGLIVCDENTRSLLSLPERETICLAPGETHKTWSAVDAILKRSAALGLNRDGVLYGLGGGVVCDMTAFAASLFKRGCKLTLIPTTLLCMVDAAVGGKTGIDYQGYKNLIGTFYPAEIILIATELLKGLPVGELLNGVVETLKHGMIGNPDLLDYLEEKGESILKGDKEAIDALVWPSMDVKIAIVREDLYEKGVRAYLNLGHTFGHALESILGLGAVSHGEAVAWGLGKALETAHILGLCELSYKTRIHNILTRYGIGKTFRIKPAKMIQAMGQDKKRLAGKFRLVLPVKAGTVVIREMEERELITILEKLG